MCKRLIAIFWEIEEAYNKLFQDCRAKEYCDRELKFPEMCPDVNYQKDAVMRVISEKNTLLAFDVGAGKTYIMIAAAMKMRQEGKSRRNLFVVPNHIVGQWELIFKQMYPTAKVLSVDTSKYRFVLRFARFFNLPELSRLFSQIAAFHAVDDNEGIPRLERYSDVILPHNAALQGYAAFLRTAFKPLTEM